MIKYRIRKVVRDRRTGTYGYIVERLHRRWGLTWRTDLLWRHHEGYAHWDPRSWCEDIEAEEYYATREEAYEAYTETLQREVRVRVALENETTIYET